MWRTWYAQKWVETEKWRYVVGGFFAALWTPETYQNTAWTLIGAKSFVCKGSRNEPIHYGFDLLGRNVIHIGQHTRWGWHIGIGWNQAKTALLHVCKNRLYWKF